MTNEGNRFVPFFYYHVDYRKYASLPADMGYFHAYYRQERPARQGRNYAFLDTQATGHYVGTVMSVVLTQISWFGEGDDLFYIDGAKQPQLYGTGTEDYFNDGLGPAGCECALDWNADCGGGVAGVEAGGVPVARSRSHRISKIDMGGDRAFGMDFESGRFGAIGV